MAGSESANNSGGSYAEQLQARLAALRSGKKLPTTDTPTNGGTVLSAAETGTPSILRRPNDGKDHTFDDLFDSGKAADTASDGVKNQAPKIIEGGPATAAIMKGKAPEEQTGDGAGLEAYDKHGNRITAQQLDDQARQQEADRLASSPGMKSIDENEAKRAAKLAEARAAALAAKAAEKAANPEPTDEEKAKQKELARQLKLYKMMKSNPGLQMN